MFKTAKITEIPTDTPSVYAFRVLGGVTSDEMAGVAEVLEKGFERHGKVNILFLLEDFDMSDAVSSSSLKSLAAQVRSVSHVRRYAVVGAPSVAATMINTFDKVTLIEANTFEPGEEAGAWRFVGARPGGTAEGAIVL